MAEIDATAVLRRLQAVGEAIAQDVQTLVGATARDLARDASALYPAPFRAVEAVQLGPYRWKVRVQNRRVNFFDTRKPSNIRRTASGQSRGRLTRHDPPVMPTLAPAYRRTMVDQLQAIADRDREV